MTIQDLKISNIPSVNWVCHGPWGIQTPILGMTITTLAIRNGISQVFPGPKIVEPKPATWVSTRHGHWPPEHHQGIEGAAGFGNDATYKARAQGGVQESRGHFTCDADERALSTPGHLS